MDNQDQTIYMREMPHLTSSFEKGKKRKQENKRTKSVGTLADCEWRAAAPLAARPATIVCYYLAKGWRAQEATMCGWESRYLCLYCSCPVRDNVAQSCHHQGRRQWSWLSAYSSCVWDCCSILTSCQDPFICEPFDEYVLYHHLLSCWVKRYKHVAMWWHGYWLETRCVDRVCWCEASHVVKLSWQSAVT